MSGRCPVPSLVLTPDSTRADIEEAIANLRQRQRRCVIASTAAEVGDVIDYLLDQWTSRAGSA